MQINKTAIPVLMTAAVAFACKILSSRISVSRKSVFAKTYSVFILSWPVQQAIEIVSERILRLPIYVITPAMFLGGAVLSVLVLKIIDVIEKKFKITFFSKMLGEVN